MLWWDRQSHFSTVASKWTSDCGASYWHSDNDLEWPLAQLSRSRTYYKICPRRIVCAAYARSVCDSEVFCTTYARCPHNACIALNLLDLVNQLCPRSTLCSKKHVTTFLMISWSRIVRLERFLAHLLLRVQVIDRCFYFPTSPILCSYFTLGNCQDLNISKN